MLDIQSSSAPVALGSIDVSPYGAVANSVDVSDGVVAVAVENAEKTEPGVVVFLGADGWLLSRVTVGALPDMLTFTPDGTKVLVANEGAPLLVVGNEVSGSTRIFAVLSSDSAP